MSSDLLLAASGAAVVLALAFVKTGAVGCFVELALEEACCFGISTGIFAHSGSFLTDGGSWACACGGEACSREGNGGDSENLLQLHRMLRVG